MMRPLFNSFSNQIQTNETSAPPPQQQQQVRPPFNNFQGNSMLPPNSAQFQPPPPQMGVPQIANLNPFNIHHPINGLPNRPTSPFFMNAPNGQFPLQQNGMSPLGSASGQPPGQFFFNGFGPQNMMDHQINTCQPNAQLFSHNSMNISPYLNQQHVSFPNGQACGQAPMQNNATQFIQMQMPMPNYTQGNMPMFQSHVSQTVAPQNQNGTWQPRAAWQHGNQEQQQPHRLLPLNGPNAAQQQLQGNNSSHSVQPKQTQNFDLAFVKSQGNPGKENGVNIPNTKWKKPPNKNFASHRKGDASHFQQTQNANGKFKFHNEHGEKAHKNGARKSALVASNQTQVEKKRSLPLNYTEREIQQWREERKKNYPSKDNVDKKLTTSEIADTDAKLRRQQLKEILAKQAELGCEVAELPLDYLSDSEKLMGGRGDNKRAFGNKGRPQNKFNNKRGGRFNKNDRFTKNQKQGPAADHHASSSNVNDQKGEDNSNYKKQRLGNSNLSMNSSIREPTSLLRKLLCEDIRRDKAHLLQVFRFIVMNSYLKNCPEKKQLLRFPHVAVKEVEKEGYLVEDNNVNVVSKINNGNKIIEEVNSVDDKTEPRVSKETGTGGFTSTSRIIDEEEGEIID